MFDYGPGKVCAPIELWREGVIALVEYAVGYPQGRSKDDPVYKQVTENRDGPTREQRKRYSSCGDLGHWLLMRLGVRESWVNRTDDGVYGPWMPGENISDLWGASCPIDIVPKADWVPEPGDILVIWNTGFDAHVCVSSGKIDQGRLLVYEYGKGGMSPEPIPGSGSSKPKLTWNGKQWCFGSKFVQRVVRLSDIIQHINARPDFSGAALTGDVMDALEYGVNGN